MSVYLVLLPETYGIRLQSALPAKWCSADLIARMRSCMRCLVLFIAWVLASVTIWGSDKYEGYVLRASCLQNISCLSVGARAPGKLPQVVPISFTDQN